MRKRIFIAVPQYQSFPMDKEMALAQHFGFKDWVPTGFHPMFSLSLAGLKKTGHEFVVNCLKGDGLIERSRSTLFGLWLDEWKKGNKYDYFWMLDEDVQFHESAIDSMIRADKPIIGAAYPYKVDNGPKAGKSVCKYLDGQRPDENGILKIRWLNGGFILARADALLKMTEHHPDLKYQRFQDSEGDDLGFAESYGFWMAMVHTIETGQRILLSEDYAFCQRATEAGNEIFLDTKIQLAHWAGSSSFKVGKVTFQERDREGIPGWCSQEELDWLGSVAREMDSIAEIGSWKGRSADVLLKNCKGEVYCIDTFQGSERCITSEIIKTENVYEEFVKNVGHYENLRVMQMSSQEAAEQFNGRKVSMTYIDGDHRYESVRKDIENWLPKTERLICGHDYQETFRAVHEMLGQVNVEGDIWWKYLDKEVRPCP